MCDHKLSSDEVPKKFAEWLLSMGCSPEKVPTVDKVVEMCRGQYYMVWRSLMEHVEPKDVIRQKRLHVFCDDVYKWKRKNAFNKPDNSTVMPSELVLWQQHKDVKDKVVSAEERLVQARQDLNQLMEKISSKLSQRNLCRRSVQNVQRRAWMLQQVADELRNKKENLEETRGIADSLCSTDEEIDVQSKLDRYLSSHRRGNGQASNSLLAANPVASSSVVSNGDVNDNNEENLSWLSRCRGDALWPHLVERRARLVLELARDSPNKDAADSSVRPQTVVAHTAALQCSLALEALKNRAHIKHTREKLATAVNELNSCLTGAACELLVVRCEVARGRARAAALAAASPDLAARAHACAAGGAAPPAAARHLVAVDKAIESKKEDLKRLIASLAATEKKIYNVRECLINIFNGFHKDVSLNDVDRYRGQLEFPQESIASLRQYYEELRGRRRADLSMDLDCSERASFTDSPGGGNPKFADELRIYLKKFNLEKNRKLILESGDKIWTFESISEAAYRLQSRWLSLEAPPVLLCPSVGLSGNLRGLLALVEERTLLQAALTAAETGGDKWSLEIDISMKSQEEEVLVDKIKKRLNENLVRLQKTNKTLELGQENLKFWSGNEMRKLISHDRFVDGKNYKDYEDIYIINMN